MTAPNCMVSIGHFAQPSIIELQAKVIRATCGDVPILVSDDHTETAHDDTKGVTAAMGAERKARLLEICERERLIYRDTAERRIGHAGGDLGSFYHGLTYARDYGIEYLWKLSQRFIVDIPGWIAEECRRMKKFDVIVCTQPCFYGSRPLFAFRTECIGLKVTPWIRPDVLNELRPRPLHTAAEFLLEELYAKIGQGKPFLKWSFTGKRQGHDRLIRYPDCYWKDPEPKDQTDTEYRSLADKYGVTLRDDFNVNHSCLQAGFQWG